MTRKSAPLSFRVNDRLRSALERAAVGERRSVSSLVTNVLSDWADTNGHYSDDPEHGYNDRIDANRYSAVPGRPRKVPDASDNWLDAQVDEKLSPNNDYDIEAACAAVTGRPLSEAVQYYDKALSNSLLRTGWVEVNDTATQRRVWIKRERFSAAASNSVNDVNSGSLEAQ